MSHFDPRDLRAFSVEPLLLYPTHYTGQPGYFSDTETSTIWDNDTVNTDWDRRYAQKTSQQGRIDPVAQNSVTGDIPPPASRASRDELWGNIFHIFQTSSLTDSQTARFSMSSSPRLLGETSANSMTAGWDAWTPLAGWSSLGGLCTEGHKNTQAPFISTLFISSCLPKTFRGRTVPGGYLKSLEGWTQQGFPWGQHSLPRLDSDTHRHMGVRFGFGSARTRLMQKNLYLQYFFFFFPLFTILFIQNIEQTDMIYG